MSSKPNILAASLKMKAQSLMYSDEQSQIGVKEILYDAGKLPMHLRCDVLSTLVKRLANLT